MSVRKLRAVTVMKELDWLITVDWFTELFRLSLCILQCKDYNVRVNVFFFFFFFLNFYSVSHFYVILCVIHHDSVKPCH